MPLLPPDYVPRRSHTIHSEILNDEICIYDWITLRVHALNATAARVWEMCDGVTSVAQIANRLRADLSAPGSPPRGLCVVGWSVVQVDEVVSLAVAEFSEAGLLEGPLPAGQLALSRRDIVKRLGLTAAMLPVVSSIAAPSALQAQSQNVQTFLFTGAAQTFVVPAGVTQISVDAVGGAAGLAGAIPNFGLGGRVTATIPVTAGETLTVNVGGQGESTLTPGVFSPPGGFNGGGAGSGEGIGPVSRGGSGGGGASDVRRGSTKLVVAGGGGGNAALGPAGGPGGGLTGGGGGNNSTTGAAGGGGGTQSAGGSGGGAGLGGAAGTPGASGAGGSGAGFGGAGGGGGYFGGGGGGGSTQTGNDRFLGGGGGGGSSYTDPAATFVTHSQGFGGGRVTISW